MAVNGIDHLYLESKHFDRSVEFWKTLGFDVVSEWGQGEYKACQLKSGKALVVLTNGGEVKPTAHFSIENADVLAKKLEESEHVEVTTPLEDTHWGTRWIRVRDPDGNEYALEDVGR